MNTDLVLLVLLVVALSQVAMVVYFFRGKQAGVDNDQKGWDVLHDAMKKSQAIVGQAELAGIKERAIYQQDMKMTVEEVEESLKREVAKAGQKYEDYLEKMLGDVQKKLEGSVETMESGLGETMKAVEAAAVGRAEQYRKDKMRKIDENAEEIMERAVEIYLGKKLDRKEHMQLVFEAMERAKAEKSIP